MVFPAANCRIIFFERFQPVSPEMINQRGDTLHDDTLYAQKYGKNIGYCIMGFIDAGPFLFFSKYRSISGQLRGMRKPAR
ncbi:MAG: hypothetical protein JRH13_08950 [Deltaproteobacteria bacterium]|nr:hypothetical protein [Deltaproteobacteria bacterium]MBW2303266.1 hypothetical protein [Deltaproteobacteria bacterium]